LNWFAFWTWQNNRFAFWTWQNNCMTKQLHHSGRWLRFSRTFRTRSERRIKYGTETFCATMLKKSNMYATMILTFVCHSAWCATSLGRHNCLLGTFSKAWQWHEMFLARPSSALNVWWLNQQINGKFIIYIIYLYAPMLMLYHIIICTYTYTSICMYHDGTYIYLPAAFLRYTGAGTGGHAIDAPFMPVASCLRRLVMYLS
jgi:hypothetical protein